MLAWRPVVQQQPPHGEPSLGSRSERHGSERPARWERPGEPPPPCAGDHRQSRRRRQKHRVTEETLFSQDAQGTAGERREDHRQRQDG